MYSRMGTGGGDKVLPTVSKDQVHDQLMNLNIRLNPGALCLSCTEEPKTGHRTPGEGSTGQDHLPQPAGNALPNVPQDTIGLLGHQYHSWLMDRLLSTRTPGHSMQSCFPLGQPPACTGVWGYSCPGAGPAFALVEFQTVPPCPCCKPVKVLLKGCTALWGISHSSQLCVIGELAEEASAPSSKSLMNKLNNTGPSIDPWGDTTRDRPLTRPSARDYDPLRLDIQPVLNQPYCPLVQPTLPELAYEGVMGDSVKSLAKVEVNVLFTLEAPELYAVVQERSPNPYLKSDPNPNSEPDSNPDSDTNTNPDPNTDLDPDPNPKPNP
ncbi:hypothetical protein BTVI_145394 [Pitangus sulphuratus]|nr:hypothetical protein BTVI_145394 [Pitangus sulphuratus]